MPNIIRIKRRATGGAAGAPASLATSELAYNEADNTLYIGFGDSGAGVATSVRAIGGDGAYLTLSGTQTVSGAKDFSTVPTISGSLLLADNSTKIATTAFVKGQNYLTANQSISVSGDASGSGTTAITLTLATVNSNVGTFTKVTVNAKGLVTAATTLAATDIPTLTAAKISDFDTQVRTSRLDQMAAPTASVSLNSQTITNLATPSASTDAANKAYVDSVATGLDVKQSVRTTTTANITSLAGGAPNTLDGVTLAVNDRILVKDQTTASQNGIYVVQTVGTGANGTWVRASDFDTSAEVTAGAFTFVAEGTLYADSGWVLATNDVITLGTTALTWAQFSGAGAGTNAGAGLTKTGNTIDVGAGTGIVVNADDVALTGQALAVHNLATNGLITRTGAGTVAGRTLTGTSNRLTVTNGDGVSGDPTVDIASTYVGQSTITTLGTIGTGTWNGTVISLQYGGTGSNLSAASDGAIFKKSGTTLVAATAGTDYLNDASTILGGTF